MKTIYLDSDFRCNITNTGGLQAVETDIFDGKCYRYIEGYRFVPEGQTWTRDDGVQFTGPMVSPHKNYDILADYQEQYEESATELQDAEDELSEIESALGVNT